MWLLWSIAIFLVGLTALLVVSQALFVAVMLWSTPEPEWTRRRNVMMCMSADFPLITYRWVVRSVSATIPPCQRVPTGRGLEIASRKTEMLNLRHELFHGILNRGNDTGL